MKMVDINDVFIKEEAKHPRDTHQCIVSMQNSNSSTQLTHQHVNQSYYGQQRIIFSLVIISNRCFMHSSVTVDETNMDIPFLDIRL